MSRISLSYHLLFFTYNHWVLAVMKNKNKAMNGTPNGDGNYFANNSTSAELITPSKYNSKALVVLGSRVEIKLF
jgi:hypothetical protein